MENVRGSCKDALAISDAQNMIIVSILSSLRSAAENKMKETALQKDHPGDNL